MTYSPPFAKIGRKGGPPESELDERRSAEISSLTRVALLKFIHHAIQIGITGAKTPGEPVTAPLSDCFSISDHFKLTRVAGCNYRFNAQALLNHGHETRDLGF